MIGAEKKIKVTHILTDTGIGGAGKYLLYLTGAGRKDTFEYSVILPRGAKIAEELKNAGIRVIEADSPDFRDRSRAPGANKELRRLLLAEKPDIVHTHGSMTGIKSARAAGVKVRFMTRHCADLPPKYLRHFPGKLFCRGYFKKYVTAAVATDESARDALLSCGMPEEKITVIRNGAEPLRDVTDAEKSALRRELGIPENTYVVGCFARLEAPKAHEILLRAVSVTKRFAGNVYFIIVGDGSRRAELEELARKLHVDDVVRFCGFVNDIAPYMAICTLNVNTSTGTETSNLAISEGLSLGVVPVVSDFGGNPRSVEGVGVVYPDNDPACLAEEMLKLFRDPEQIRYLSAAGKKEFSARRTAEKMASKTETLYLRYLYATEK